MARVEDTFWVVWCEGGGAPTVKHGSIESAKAESIRLARVSPGNRFIVLQAVGAAEKIDVIHTVFSRRELRWGDDLDVEIPF